MAHRERGGPSLWIGTNHGTAYIPAGVYVPATTRVTTVVLAGGFDADFDSRWFGWLNPAETVLRAIREACETVSALATTSTEPSEMLDEYEQRGLDVATGVRPGRAGGPAAQLAGLRQHRLEALDWRLYRELQDANRSLIATHCGRLAGHVGQMGPADSQAFFGGQDLSRTVLSVAQTLADGRWPKPHEWKAVGAQYEDAQMACAMRPGRDGVEDPMLTGIYRSNFVVARRLETLVCIERDRPMDAAYAAWVAGVRIPMAAIVQRSHAG